MRIPWREFVPVKRARVDRGAPDLDPARVRQLGLVLSRFEFNGLANPNFRAGPFSLTVPTHACWPLSRVQYCASLHQSPCTNSSVTVVRVHARQAMCEQEMASSNASIAVCHQAWLVRSASLVMCPVFLPWCASHQKLGRDVDALAACCRSGAGVRGFSEPRPALVFVTSAGVERNALIGDDEAARKADIPIVQVGLFLG